MKQQTRDNLIYLGVAGTIVAALTFYVFYTDRTLGTTPEIPGPILWGIISTPGIVALTLEAFWKYRRRGALWVIVAIVAAINISVVALAYHQGWEIPVLWWSIPTGLCMIPLFVVTAKILGRDTGVPAKYPRQDCQTGAHSQDNRAKPRE